MGSGVLLAALVVLWFVVLVPMVVTRGDTQGGRVEAADAGRTLQRRRGTTVAAETERVDIDGDWRDHLSYALLAEDVPGGVLARWRSQVPGSQ